MGCAFRAVLLKTGAGVADGGRNGPGSGEEWQELCSGGVSSVVLRMNALHFVMRKMLRTRLPHECFLFVNAGSPVFYLCGGIFAASPSSFLVNTAAGMPVDHCYTDI